MIGVANAVAILLFIVLQQAPASGADGDIAKALSFLLLGDWGKGGTSGTFGQRKLEQQFNTEKELETMKRELKEKKILYQMQVSRAMNNYTTHADVQPSFLVALGDNFYDDGVYSSTDPLWDYLWKDVYLGYEGLNIPWYPVFGNHDYGYGASGVQAQIQRTYDHTDDDIWTFPSTNYTRRFAIPGADGDVCIVFIDTTTLAPSENRCCNENGGVSQEVQMQRITNQLTHIERALNETLVNPPSWLLVAGHYPIFSASSNGDVPELITYLLPLLEQYHVHAYICGHDHIAEHLQYGDYFTEFYVVGAGTMTDTIKEGSSEGELMWAGPNYASFAVMTANATHLGIEYYDTNTTQRYQHTLNNPHRQASVIGGGGGGGGGGDGGGSEGDSDDGKKTKRPSLLTFRYWSMAARDPTVADVAMASGGLALLGLILFACVGAFRRVTQGKDDKYKKQKGLTLLKQTAAAKLMASPRRSTYVELMELGETSNRFSDHSDSDNEYERPDFRNGSRADQYALVTETTAETTLPSENTQDTGTRTPPRVSSWTRLSDADNAAENMVDTAQADAALPTIGIAAAGSYATPSQQHQRQRTTSRASRTSQQSAPRYNTPVATGTSTPVNAQSTPRHSRQSSAAPSLPATPAPPSSTAPLYTIQLTAEQLQRMSTWMAIEQATAPGTVTVSASAANSRPPSPVRRNFEATQLLPSSSPPRTTAHSQAPSFTAPLGIAETDLLLSGRDEAATASSSGTPRSSAAAESPHQPRRSPDGSSGERSRTSPGSSSPSPSQLRRHSFSV